MLFTNLLGRRSKILSRFTKMVTELTKLHDDVAIEKELLNERLKTLQSDLVTMSNYGSSIKKNIENLETIIGE